MKNSLSIVALSLAVATGGVAAQQEGISADVNIGHLAPFADTIAGTAVSIDIDGTENFNPVVFKDFTGYTEIVGDADPFDVFVEVFAPPGAASAAIDGTLSLENNTGYTVAAVGGANGWPLEFLVLTDFEPQTIILGETQARLRIVHAAPFAPTSVGTEVDIRTDAGDVVNGLTNVPYKGESGFFEVPAGTYDLQVTTPGGGTALIDLAPVTLNAGDEVTVFAVGDIVNQPVGAVAFFPDGTTVDLPLEEPLGDIRSVPTLGWLGIALMALLLGGIGVRRMI